MRFYKTFVLQDNIYSWYAIEHGNWPNIPLLTGVIFKNVPFSNFPWDNHHPSECSLPSQLFKIGKTKIVWVWKEQGAPTTDLF